MGKRRKKKYDPMKSVTDITKVTIGTSVGIGASHMVAGAIPDQYGGAQARRAASLGTSMMPMIPLTKAGSEVIKSLEMLEE